MYMYSLYTIGFTITIIGAKIISKFQKNVHVHVLYALYMLHCTYTCVHVQCYMYSTCTSCIIKSNSYTFIP